MARRPERNKPDPRYLVRFLVSAVLLVAGTLVLVLVVLPERYILSSGFVEAGSRFPAARVPFAPSAPLLVGARPAVYIEPVVLVRGPAEVFWEAVLPLARQRSFADAIPLFERYLASYPHDVGVRREYALTLVQAGRPADAVPVMEAVLQVGEDVPLRLELARTLRDLGAVDRAAGEYARLSAALPADTSLILEWGHAYAWAKRYDEAARVFGDGLSRMPRSVALRAELARVHYFNNRLRESESILSAMSPAELVAGEVVTLYRDVRAALAVPEVVVAPAPPAPSLLDRAIAAREADDLQAARALFQDALRERPRDAAVWLAWANFLEYEASDFDAARLALLEVQRLGADSRELQLRMAVLEAWTNRRDAAITRIGTLLTATDAAAGVGADSVAVANAELMAMMGDLIRWDGDRFRALDVYRTALDSDSTNARARAGLAAIQADVARIIDAAEGPRTGAHVYSLGDTDDFTRFDVAADWIGVRGARVWGVTAGRRWLGGRDLARAHDERTGSYVEVNPAHWWRLGTVRAAAHLGVQFVRENEADVSYGAGIRWRGTDGSGFSSEFRHEPAYQFAPTLQTVLADVVVDRLSASYDRSLSERWTMAIQADVARLEARGLAESPRVRRVQAVGTVGRAMSDRWSLGWSSLASSYRDPAPVVGQDRLFWDPGLVISGGPYASVRGPLANRWEASLRVSPGLALIEERRVGDREATRETVPQLGAEARAEYFGTRYRLAIDVFYAQARLEGYRTYGARMSLSTASWLSDRLVR